MREDISSRIFVKNNELVSRSKIDTVVEFLSVHITVTDNHDDDTNVLPAVSACIPVWPAALLLAGPFAHTVAIQFLVLSDNQNGASTDVRP